VSVIHVSCAAEGAYVAHSAAMLHSVLAHRGGHGVRVHYLHGPGFPARSEELLTEMVERGGGSISFLPVADRRIAGLPAQQFTSAMWYRIFLPELLPELERILYLDIDTIVVDSLDPLWQTNLAGYYLAAVTNVFEPHYLHRPAELGLSGPEAYFNSGVLLMNLEEMRRLGCTPALRDYALEHGDRLLWPDQDTLNVVLGAQRLPLHPRWNLMNSVLTMQWSPDVLGAAAVEEARRRPAVRHFEGPTVNKPWHYLCDYPMRELYFEHRRQTPWPHCKLEGVTPRNVLQRLARGARRRAARLPRGRAPVSA
jgi:lipopolysaccharide biosynthesis glycosyltransferase